jgi:transcription elongation factor Elf1
MIEKQKKELVFVFSAPFFSQTKRKTMTDCPECGLNCCSSMTLAYHMRHFHDKLACARCGKAFATRATFGRHVATHLSAR